MSTLNSIIKACTNEYLEQIDVDNPPLPIDVEAELVIKIREACFLENQIRAKGDMIKPPTMLFSSQIAAIMLKLHNIVNVVLCDSGSQNSKILAIYLDEEGIYSTDTNYIKHIAREYNYCATCYEINEVIEHLKLDAKCVKRTQNPDLIAVNNGIWDYQNKVLLPFSSEYIFLAKSCIDYNESATNILIHNEEDGTDWDIESWMNELSDDPEIVELLWQILGAVIRPFVRWNKSAWLFSTYGNNGKGCLCRLARNLCGERSCASIPLNSFSKDFALEPLVHSTAIIVDENDVGSYLDKSSVLKAVVTNDVVSINPKYRAPFSYQFHGFMIQCINELPNVKDKSDSFYRRQLFIPFDKCFTGKERKYIKDDYLNRQEVLEYVLFKVLNMNYYSLIEPESCKNALAEYKEFNDPIRQFLDEILPQVEWDLLPFSFLYELYKSWHSKSTPTGKVEGRNTFINQVLNVLPAFSDWYCIGKDKEVRRGNMMDKPCKLIIEYDLVDWKNSTYTGRDELIISCPADSLKPKYRGILRNKQCDDEKDHEVVYNRENKGAYEYE